MSSHTKIVLRKKPNKVGLYPLAICITKNRRSTFRYIGHYIVMEEWDDKNLSVKKSHPNYQHLNSLLAMPLNILNWMAKSI